MESGRSWQKLSLKPWKDFEKFFEKDFCGLLSASARSAGFSSREPARCGVWVHCCIEILAVQQCNTAILLYCYRAQGTGHCSQCYLRDTAFILCSTCTCRRVQPVRIISTVPLNYILNCTISTVYQLYINCRLPTVYQLYAQPIVNI